MRARDAASAAEIEQRRSGMAARKAQARMGARADRRARAKMLPAAVDAMLRDERRDRARARLADGPAGPLCGGEMRRLRGARAPHDRDRARGAGAGRRRTAKAGFTRYDPARAGSASCSTIAPWNYPYLTAVNTVVPALMAGNAVHPQARRADAAGRRAFPGAMDHAGLPKGLFQNLVARARRRPPS